MKWLKWQWLSVFLMCAGLVASFGAEIRPEIVKATADGFHVWFSRQMPPGTLSAEMETAYLALYAIENAANDLTSEEWAEVALRLRVEKNYRVGALPAAEVRAISNARLNSTTAALGRFYVDKIELLRRATPVPRSQVTLGPANRPVLLNDKLRGPEDLDLALDLIASTPTGKDLVAKARAKIAKGELKIERMHDGIRASYIRPCYALHVFGLSPSGEERSVIYMDFDVDLGLFAEYLVHELEHNLNSVSSAAKRRLATEFLPRWQAAWEDAAKKAAARHGIRFGEVTESHLNLEERESVRKAKHAYQREENDATQAAEKASHDKAAKWISEMEAQHASAGPYYLAQRQRGLSHPKAVTEEMIQLRYPVTRNCQAIGRAVVDNGVPQIMVP